MTLHAAAYLQDLGTACCIRQRHVNDAVEPAGTDERSVDGARPVGGAQDDQTTVVLKPIHLQATEQWQAL